MIVIVVMAACKKMDDTYRQFIEHGETVYIAKADSIKVRGGLNRLEVSWLLLSDPKVDRYKLFWNSRQDSLEKTVTKTQDVDTVRVMLNDMEEGTHYFEIVMFDKDGNSSLPVETFGVVYGERYQSGLLGRTYRDIGRIENNLEVDWMPAEPSLVGVEVRYQNTDGNLIKHIVSSSVGLDTLENFPIGGSFEYRSVFRPDSTSLDLFYTDFVSYKEEETWNMDFSTTLRYGTQANQFSVWVSQDFNGVYELEDVKAATWTDVTDRFTLATDQTVTASDPMDVGSLLLDDQYFYVAFRYNFVPGLETTQRTWTVRGFKVTSQITGAVIFDQPESDFQLVTEGPWEVGRLMITPELITLRGNSGDQTSPVTAWAISKKIE